MKHNFFKTAIVIAVFSNFSIGYAQKEYNNWLINKCTILNFDTSPATIICNKNDEINTGFTQKSIALSDDNGNIILYGYKGPSNFVVKNNENKQIVSFECNNANVIGAKLPQNGYYIAAVSIKMEKHSGELHIYKFDKYGKLEKEYLYDDAYYSFFIDFMRIENYIVLIAYRKGQIETYKLTQEDCSLWKTSEIELDSFLHLLIPSYAIVHSSDNRKIIATTYGTAYILNFDKKSGKITISDKFESNKFYSMTFSNTDKYFLIIDDDKLKGFRYDKNFDFNLDNPEIIYDLPKTNEFVCNQCWTMAIGIDNKLYIHEQGSDHIIVLNGIESENITEEIISSECVIKTNFPQIIRNYVQDCKTSILSKPQIIVE